MYEKYGHWSKIIEKEFTPSKYGCGEKMLKVLQFEHMVKWDIGNLEKSVRLSKTPEKREGRAPTRWPDIIRARMDFVVSTTEEKAVIGSQYSRNRLGRDGVDDLRMIK